MKLINPKELIKGIAMIVLYYILPFIIAIPFSYLYKKNIINYSWYLIILYFFMSLIFFLIYMKDMIKDFKDFRKNFKDMMYVAIKYWAKGLGVMFISSMLFTIIKLPNNTNQDANISLLETIPVAEFICAVLFAPILEELVFRKSLSKSINNKHLYAISTGLIFGMIHVTSSIHGLKDLIMLLYLIPYSAMGVAFGYTYKDTNNIYASMFMHAMHNCISLLISLLAI